MAKKLLIVATTALLVFLLSSCVVSCPPIPTNDETIAEKNKCEAGWMKPYHNSCGRIQCVPFTQNEINYKKSVDLCISQGKTWTNTLGGIPLCNQ